MVEKMGLQIDNLPKNYVKQMVGNDFPSPTPDLLSNGHLKFHRAVHHASHSSPQKVRHHPNASSELSAEKTFLQSAKPAIYDSPTIIEPAEQLRSAPTAKPPQFNIVAEEKSAPPQPAKPAISQTLEIIEPAEQKEIKPDLSSRLESIRDALQARKFPHIASGNNYLKDVETWLSGKLIELGITDSKSLNDIVTSVSSSPSTKVFEAVLGAIINDQIDPLDINNVFIKALLQVEFKQFLADKPKLIKLLPNNTIIDSKNTQLNTFFAFLVEDLSKYRLIYPQLFEASTYRNPIKLGDYVLNGLSSNSSRNEFLMKFMMNLFDQESLITEYDTNKQEISRLNLEKAFVTYAITQLNDSRNEKGIDLSFFIRLSNYFIKETISNNHITEELLNNYPLLKKLKQTTEQLIIVYKIDLSEKIEWQGKYI